MKNTVDFQIKSPKDPLKMSLPLNLPSENLTNNMIHKGFRCDGCSTNPIIGFRFHCTICKDFDYCDKCEAKIPHPHCFVKIRRVIEENRSSNLNSLNQSQILILENVKEYKVQIINVTNNINAMVKKTYTNSISIKNSGCNKWPDNTELKCVSGLHKDTSEGIPSLNSGEEYKVNLVLQAPDNPGTYACSWRLAYRIKNDMCYFGAKIDFNVNVEGKFKKIYKSFDFLKKYINLLIFRLFYYFFIDMLSVFLIISFVF